jgi:hypothetical protein
MAIKNISGQKFGRLTVIKLNLEFMSEKKKINDRSAYWNCICECGNTTISRGTTLICGKAKSCGCLMKERVSETHTKDFGISNINNLYKNYKQAAYRKNFRFNLTLIEFSNLILKPCHYCGVSDSLTNVAKNINGNRLVKHNGIDRINNEIGYELNNCVPCCTFCNYAKRTSSYEDFVFWINNLVDFKNSRRENVTNMENIK